MFLARSLRTFHRRDHGPVWRDRVALPRDAADGRSSFDRAARGRLIVQRPAADGRTDAADLHADQPGPSPFGVLESRLRDDARLEVVRLAAREMAHLLNNDLALA